MTLREFADEHGLTITVLHQINCPPPLRYYARLEWCEGTPDKFRCGTGHGDTEEAALAALAKEVSGQRLIVHPYTKERRREVQVPELMP